MGDDVPMFQRPVSQRLDEMGEAGSGLRQSVVDLGRHGWIDSPKRKAISFEPTDRERKHALRNTVDCSL